MSWTGPNEPAPEDPRPPPPPDAALPLAPDDEPDEEPLEDIETDGDLA